MDTPEKVEVTPADAAAISRRKFLSVVCVALGGVAAVAIAAPLTGFVVAPVFEHSPEVWRDVGAVTDFADSTTTQVSYRDATSLPWAGVSARTAAWLRHDTGESFTAFAVNCSHLGCPVRWLPKAGLFMCPCHGGVYYADGEVAAGPPPHRLSTYPVRVVTNTQGQRRVEILASPVPITTG